MTVWISDNFDKIPFSEELGVILSDIICFLDRDTIFSVLDKMPFLKIVSSLEILIITLWFALIWIEALREMKIKEYKGEDVSVEKFKEIILSKVDDIKQILEPALALNPAT